MESKDVESKKDILLELLKWSSAFVQLDARVEGVSVPEFLMGERGVVLQIGYDMPNPILDLTIDDDGVRATLSFRRVPHRCVVPWRAVYAITDGGERRAVFPEDMPKELSAPPAPARALAPLAAPDDEPTSSPPSPPTPKRPRPSHLKLVK